MFSTQSTSWKYLPKAKLNPKEGGVIPFDWSSLIHIEEFSKVGGAIPWSQSKVHREQ